MSCPCTFEPSIQVNCVLELIGLVRSGDLVSQRAEALKHVGCILGSLGEYLGGDVTPVMRSDAAEPCTLEEAADQLEAALSVMKSDEAGKINPDNLALLLNFMMQLLPLLLPLFVKS